MLLNTTGLEIWFADSKKFGNETPLITFRRFALNLLFDVIVLNRSVILLILFLVNNSCLKMAIKEIYFKKLIKIYGSTNYTSSLNVASQL